MSTLQSSARTRRVRRVMCLAGPLLGLSLLLSSILPHAYAMPDAPPVFPAGATVAEPDQLGGWQGIALDSAACGRGAAFTYYLNAADDPQAGLFFLLNGGGACMKEGHAPPGAGGPARQLHCMDYGQFVDPLMNGLVVSGLPTRIRYFRRNEADNPFREYTYVFVPYCTGDVHAGSMSEPYDYDPDPDAEFEVVHRGHLNVLAILEDVHSRYPGNVPVVLTGMSAGGFGAIYNYPDFVRRWPRTTLLPDAGIAPPHPQSLMAREGERVAERWGSRKLLPDYCDTDDCLAGTMRLLTAHAAHYDGVSAPWRPFGYLQGQQDGVLAAYLEISRCSYQLGLRRGMIDQQPPNLRAFVPATADHVFGATPRYQTPVGGVDLMSWFAAVTNATSEAELPPDAIDPWLPCNLIQLPYLSRALR